ncbi:MAG: glutamate racemase [Flammeovirgaceae bacterium]|nr:glutamate racemase [Flammeovirgaceae bacterium]
MNETGPIGVFDSGYGGLTVLKGLVKYLPEHDFLYLGDNARAPYGPRSFECIYEFTLQGVKHLFGQGCSLVVLACNTASSEALRTIQQKDLPYLGAYKRVLGVLRPTTESVLDYTQTKEIGILGTYGTIRSKSYLIEIKKFFPQIEVHQQACPMWVPLVENVELSGSGVVYFVDKYLKSLLQKGPNIDAIFLACTHYPLLYNLIRGRVPKHINVYSQAEMVGPKLATYLSRHPEIDMKCLKNSKVSFMTTDDSENFECQAQLFYGQTLQAQQVNLDVQ